MRLHDHIIKRIVDAFHLAIIMSIIILLLFIIIYSYLLGNFWECFSNEWIFFFFS